MTKCDSLLFRSYSRHLHHGIINFKLIEPSLDTLFIDQANSFVDIANAFCQLRGSEFSNINFTDIYIT